ncbi:MAG: phospho-N-acetylmuramoyl-pentapeptide-transferase [Candidatus Yanofskybacteria bacterium RIFCSPLOWO2_01_FULL_49_25]|uniref:Phospho-N-acetylmuramoyl-pentapeptide-transferase n=1 Tax=Candidatus Yanofskybacteria bacterium RIFCSPLOWO2_01_FULL_49_25 TaxID=1802701 RepID=A0A1F8GUX4_9BACT|nr:MAG: phospho-N-acetylmuramoyl-pentapeptide-transferase [Candidatus Yanofskybacteria bacterium RIFCSPLOWO2_01_FULL_49_25]
MTLAFFCTLILTPLWTRIIFKYRLGKQMRPADSAPVFHDLHKGKEGTPTTGGVLIWATVAMLTMLFWTLSHFAEGFWSRINFLSRAQTWLPLAALVVAGVLGFSDDLLGVLRRGPRGGGMQMKLKIGLYTLMGILGAWWFYAKLEFNTINIPFFGDIFVGWWYIPFFVLVIFSTAFSANETDGLDGLAGGVFLTMFAAYSVIAFDQGRINLVAFIAAIIGSLIAFLWFNIFPARFFMGDTGSMSLGVTLGVIAMLTNTPLLLIPIACIFIIESGSVIVQMLSKKFRGTKVFLSTPIHHHFEAKGWHETRVTMRFWMVSAIGAIIGLIIFLVDSKIPPLLR